MRRLAALAVLPACWTGPYETYRIEEEATVSTSVSGETWYEVHALHTTGFLEFEERPGDYIRTTERGEGTVEVSATGSGGPLEVEVLYSQDEVLFALARQAGDATLAEDGTAVVSHEIPFYGAEISTVEPLPVTDTGAPDPGPIALAFGLMTPEGGTWEADVTATIAFERDYPTNYIEASDKGLTVTLVPSSRDALGWTAQ